MSSVREKRGQKERNGERQKVKPDPETRPVLCLSQRHHPAPLLKLLKIYVSQGPPGNGVKGKAFEGVRRENFKIWCTMQAHLYLRTSWHVFSSHSHSS
ncbi:unnamed protein product [Arctogadus glacialis]